ncbi:uncharacterized protein A4U43_C01F13900 [Asparagus officinalis]|uniref:Uncharacterized protein n=1 Tax=Asparagus officinalis TaxID=4686 RepID=A0A5P1FTR2_ASPOF|nr:uncharacterized protein A4U43_C01F13900 [Asparagus officinalis]
MAPKTATDKGKGKKATSSSDEAAALPVFSVISVETTVVLGVAAEVEVIFGVAVEIEVMTTIVPSSPTLLIEVQALASSFCDLVRIHCLRNFQLRGPEHVKTMSSSSEAVVLTPIKSGKVFLE